MMNLNEEFQRLNELIDSLERQNKFLKDQLDTLHRTYGCDCKPGTTIVTDTEGCDLK
jgi:hypothetical protein